MKTNSLLSFSAATFAAFFSSGPHTHAATAPLWNNDESKVTPYTLPDVLRCNDGTMVNDVKTWREKRRPEILRAYFTHMYGRTPAVATRLRFEITQLDLMALGGLATRKEITIHLFDDPKAPTIELMLYTPNRPIAAAPVFLGLNYFGNQCVHPDPDITASKLWMRPMAANGIVNNRATEATRGTHAHRWPLELALKRGYGVATFYYGDLEPDHEEGWKSGLRGYLLRKEGRTEPAADEWGALGVWAWGLSRAMDYLVTDSAVNSKQVAVFGHSRHGKTALWAGAQDERFAIVISNDSGEGGASLSRRNFGETIAYSLYSTAYWYCSNYRKFVDRADALPTDQHMLLALAAPRPLYVASAEKDALADPKGEFLSAFYAGPVYRLHGLTGLGVTEMPGVDQPVGDTIGYHLRTGEHEILAYDWQQFVAFADRHYHRR